MAKRLNCLKVTARILENAIKKKIEKNRLSCEKHALQITKELQEIEYEDVETRQYEEQMVMGPKKSLELEISKEDVKIDNENATAKIKGVFEYTEKLIKELNLLCKSSKLKFKFDGLYFIGRFIRGEGTCIIRIDWEYELDLSIKQKT